VFEVIEFVSLVAAALLVGLCHKLSLIVVNVDGGVVDERGIIGCYGAFVV